MTILLLLTCGICCGQTNLVPNGSFETYTNCPTNYSQLPVPPWYSGTAGTPDYYNSCAGSGNGTIGVPQNSFGYQNASTGNAYVGIYTFAVWGTDTIEAKEYLQIQLTDTLIAQKTYCVSFFVNLTNPSPLFFPNNWFAITEIGMLISNDSVYLNGALTLPYIPQIQSPAGLYLNDTTNWTEISGQYIAQGGEKYITIGNFNLHSDTMRILTYNTPSLSSYYFIDNVSIVDCTNEGITNNNEIKINLFPNPIFDKLNIQANNYEPTEIILYDLSSRKLLQQAFTNTATINTEKLAKGMYLYEVRNRNGIIKNGKVIKQ